MLDSVRSSIIAATFRVNDRPNAKASPSRFWLSLGVLTQP